MTFSKKCFSAFAILGALTISLPAWADIPPDDVCDGSNVGQSCDNALSNGHSSQPGICKAATCTRPTPDGAMSYACYRCEAETGAGGEPNEGGAAGSGTGGETHGGGGSAGGGSAGDAPTISPGGSSAGGSRSNGGSTSTGGTKSGSSESKSGSNDGGGCSVSQARGGAGALGAVLVALGLAATRRRRRPSPVS